MINKYLEARVRAIVKAGGAVLIEQQYYDNIDGDWSKWLKEKPVKVSDRYVMLIGKFNASLDALALSNALWELIKARFVIGISEAMADMIESSYQPKNVTYLPTSIGNFVLFLPASQPPPPPPKSAT